MTVIQEPRFLCVYVPEFAAQARLRHRSELRSEPIAILDGTPPLQTVCSTTQRARKMGISRGTTRAELDSFPGVQSLLRSQPEERSAAAALLATLWNFSPRVQVLTGHHGAHRVVVDIAGTERIFGEPAKLAQAVLRETREIGITVRLAVSENFDTAVSAAPSAGPMPYIIARGQERQALAPLQIDALESLTSEQRDTFALWGLCTLGEVAALPEPQLIARMGQAGRRLWLLARGEHPHLLQPEEERFTLEERAEFDTPVELLESLLFVLRPMLDQLVMRAVSRALALASLTVHLELTKHAAEDTAVAVETTAYARTVRPALPLAESCVLLKLLHLELQAHPPGAPVVSLRLEAEAGSQTRAQLGLFSPQLPEPSRLDVTLARLRALVGEGRVGRPKLLDSNEPESFSVEHFAVGDAHKLQERHGANGSWSDSTHGFAKSGQTLRRLRPPVLLNLRASTQPKQFFWQGIRYQVTTTYGPWRHSGNWWSTAAWSREDWDVLATASDGTNLMCRLTHDLLQQQWRLEGLYD